MRFGLLSCLAVAVSLASMTVAQPGDAHKTGKNHHHNSCSSKACSSSNSCSSAKGGNIIGVVTKEKEFKELLSQLEAAGLVGVLESSGPYTIFAPDDSAFAHSRSLDKLSGNKEKLANLLKYHVVKGKFSAEDLASKRSLTTLQGESLMINAKDGKVLVDGAIVTEPDIKASNGVIHEIDAVLVPERGK